MNTWREKLKKAITTAKRKKQETLQVSIDLLENVIKEAEANEKNEKVADELTKVL